MEVMDLKPFHASDWNAIHTAFEGVPHLDLRQAWLEQSPENFRPARVQVGWQDNALLMRAQLTDACLFTAATENQQNLWMLGDVWELFLKDAGRENYLELHVAPNGLWLQLAFSGAETVRQIRNKEVSLSDCKVDEPLFDFLTRPTDTGWEVMARLPFSSLGSSLSDLKKNGLLASFCRYDYADKETPPVLSSTSAHREVDFHRQEEWSNLSLRG